MRKRFRKSKERRDKALAGHVAHLAGKLMGRLRLRDRVNTANRWAGLHRGRTLGWTVGLLLFSLVIGSTLSVAQILHGHDDTPGADDLHISGIASVNPMFQGFHEIQNAKSYQAEQLGGMIGDGKRLKEELDSLVAKPYKTHDDSAAIIVKYHQLEYIVKSIKQENHETE